MKIPVVTDRKPRKLVRKLIFYDKVVRTVTKHVRCIPTLQFSFFLATQMMCVPIVQLSLHRNTVAVGLLPPVIGSFIGVIATSPVWAPIMLLFGIMGFPLWLVLGVGLSLVIACSAITMLLVVQVVRSKRLRHEAQAFLQGPNGQFLLFEGDHSNGYRAKLSNKIMDYVMQAPSRKLAASLVIDAIGSATFVLPIVGELADLVWAPMSAIMLSTMYSHSSPGVKYVAFLEEALPFTDFIPTATLAWYVERGHFPFWKGDNASPMLICVSYGVWIG